MNEVKSIEEVILEIATKEEYKKSAIAQWFNQNKKNDKRV